MACEHQGKVVLVGRRTAWALKLADGSPAWDGRTVQLAGGQLAQRHRLPQRQPTTTSPSPPPRWRRSTWTPAKISHTSQSRRGIVPGNLVCSDGPDRLAAAGGVDVFHELDALRKDVDQRLAARADDPQALAERGEILWNEGKLAEGVASLAARWSWPPT